MLKRLLIVFACLLAACASPQTPEATQTPADTPTAVPESVEVDESAEGRPTVPMLLGAGRRDSRICHS